MLKDIMMILLFNSLISSILESFIYNDNNRKYIPKYFSIIILIIEFITKCCKGPCKENQECCRRLQSLYSRWNVQRKMWPVPGHSGSVSDG